LENWNVFHSDNSCQQVARATETESETDLEIGDRFLTLFICPTSDGNLVLKFAGYDNETTDPSVEFDVPTTYEEIEGQWIWAYFGYHEKKQKSVAGVHFTNTNRWVVYEFERIT